MWLLRLQHLRAQWKCAEQYSQFLVFYLWVFPSDFEDSIRNFLQSELNLWDDKSRASKPPLEDKGEELPPSHP